MSGSPYRGLAPYTESDDDAARFFGREREIRIIAGNLRAARATLLYGPSGVGKSSILRAGVIHRLRSSSSRAVPILAAYVNAWADDPKVAVEQALAGAAEAARMAAPEPVMKAVTAAGAPPGDGHGGLALAVAEEPATGALEGLVERWCEATGARILLVLDQFEEYCLYHPPDADPFDEELPRVLSRRDLDVRLLISIREDELGALDRYKGRAADLLANRLRLDALSLEAGRQAIRRPVEWHNGALAPGDTHVTIEPGLDDAVLGVVAVGRVALNAQGRGTLAASGQGNRAVRVEAAYLQLVMDALWRREAAAGSSVLRVDTLTDMGGATEVVRAHVDGVMARLSAAQQAVAADAVHFLVTPSGAKIAHSASDLASYAKLDVERLRALLDRLCGGDAWLLRRVAPQEGGEPRYEIFHDVLAPAILDWRSRIEARRLRGRLRAVVVFTVALCAALAGVLAYVADPGVAHRAERWTLDARARLGGPPLTEGRLAVVDFDDRSLRALHTSLPLPRRLQAQMIDRLRRAGARVIAYDFEFGPVKHGDATLHRAIGQAGGRLVLASLHFADDGRLILFRRPQQEGVVAYAGFPLDRIGGPGSPAVYRRMDARVRLAPDVLQVPTFWYLVARKAGLKVAPWRDPVAIDYRNDVKTIPAIDVLTGRTGAASLRGKVVVVGTSSASAGDLHATPTRARVPGVQILASAILTTATHARDAARDIVLIFLLALIPVACLWLAAPYAVAAVVLAAAAYLALAQVAYDRGHVLPVAVPLAALAVSALGMVAARLLMPDEPSRGRSVR